MRHTISITFILAACALSLGILQIPSTEAGHPTPTQAETATATPSPSNPCCGKKPPLLYHISGFQPSDFTGQIAVATNYAQEADKPSVIIWDLTHQATAPHNVQWTSTNGTHRYFSDNWKRSNIGDVFGLTLDSSGNIYVAATRVYGTANLGASTVPPTPHTPTTTPAPPGSGDIYKINGNDGTVTRFVQTANAATYAGDNKIPNTGPGIGNIHYSCAYKNFYVSNFEDGKIYRINLSGDILSVWDHGHNRPTATPAAAAIEDTDVVANNPAAPFTQFGRRPWAVQVYNGRLYYSIWWEFGDMPNSEQANEIWSIGLTSLGDFTGSARREIVMPPLYTDGNFSNPVSDISFSDTGKMLLAERTMTSNSTAYGHSSRLLEYELTGSTWTLPSPNKFQIGEYGQKNNVAGGCDYDYGPGGLVWATGDFLSLNQIIYGLQGTPATGGTNVNSILIDTDDDINSQDKTWQGDVEIPCVRCSTPPQPPVIIAPDYICAVSGDYYVREVQGLTYSWTVSGGAQITGTGPRVTVTWNATGGNRTLTVLAKDADGCASFSRLILRNCDLHDTCCTMLNPKAAYKSFGTLNANGLHYLTTTLTAGPPNITRVAANIISAWVTYAPTSCGTSGPVNSYITGVTPVTGLVATIPVPQGDEVIWYTNSSTGVNLSGGVYFKFNIQFPPPPPGSCSDRLSFCVKYTFTDVNCRKCEIIRCYGPFQRGADIALP